MKLKMAKTLAFSLVLAVVLALPRFCNQTLIRPSRACEAAAKNTAYGRNEFLQCQFPYISCEKAPVSCLNQTATIDRQLVAFVAYLRSFIEETRFDFVSFEKEIEGLSSTFVQMNHTVESACMSQELALHLHFASDFFRKMVSATGEMKYYKSGGRMGYHLIFKIIDIGVRTLYMLNPQGKLDLHIRGYVGELSRLQDSLQFWGERFGNMPTVPEETRLVFFKEYEKVSDMLTALKTQVPR